VEPKASFGVIEGTKGRLRLPHLRPPRNRDTRSSKNTTTKEIHELQAN
jgi:hypothetical protein